MARADADDGGVWQPITNANAVATPLTQSNGSTNLRVVLNRREIFFEAGFIVFKTAWNTHFCVILSCGCSISTEAYERIRVLVLRAQHKSIGLCYGVHRSIFRPFCCSSIRSSPKPVAAIVECFVTDCISISNAKDDLCNKSPYHDIARGQLNIFCLY